MKAKDFEPGDRVAYVPGEANGDISHSNVERGIVSSTNEKYVFIRLSKTIGKLGWEGTTSQSCDPNDLVKL